MSRWVRLTIVVVVCLAMVMLTGCSGYTQLVVREDFAKFSFEYPVSFFQPVIDTSGMPLSLVIRTSDGYERGNDVHLDTLDIGVCTSNATVRDSKDLLELNLRIYEANPFLDFKFSTSDDYFACEKLIQIWNVIGKPVEVSFYRRPLSSTFNTLIEAGFNITSISEGKPAEELKSISSEHYQQLKTKPQFIFFKCQTAGGKGV